VSPDAAGLIARLAADAANASDGPVVIGVCGAQGSGKSTAAAQAAVTLAAHGLPTAIVSIDDIYLTRAERQTLAAEIHPLLRTRGVPGTHDVALGLEVLDGLKDGRSVRLPRFDKASDDRRPIRDWPLSPPGCRVILFEGWCVGARPQADADLVAPVNALEASEDADGRWRRHVNARLAGEYQALFARLDRLVLFAAPDFAVVEAWRTQQELDLRDAGGGGGRGGMTDAEIVRFVQHYERLTRHILRDMPRYADMTAYLDTDRRITDISIDRSDLSS
jgi:D-glycerate 3-kinase